MDQDDEEEEMEKEIEEEKTDKEEEAEKEEIGSWIRISAEKIEERSRRKKMVGGGLTL